MSSINRKGGMSDHAKERQIPVILILVGVALYVVAAFVRAGSAAVGPVLAAVLIGGIIQTVLLIAAAFLVAAVLPVSFGDARSAILKFAGAALAAGGLGALIPWGGIIALFVFLGLIMWLFELDLMYAAVLAVVYFLLSVAVAFALAAILA